jgi:hypothetical protein
MGLIVMEELPLIMVLILPKRLKLMFMPSIFSILENQKVMRGDISIPLMKV